MAQDKKKSSGKNKSSNKHRFLRKFLVKGFLPFIALLLAVFAGYLIYLDRQITSTFQGRLWSVPSRVYAQALELYSGAAINPKQLLVELTRLGYLRTTTLTPGTYSQKIVPQGQLFNIRLRSFQFADSFRASVDISLVIGSGENGSGSILSISASDGADVPLIRLEAPMIGSIFPNHGEDRVILSPDEVPDLLTRSLIAVEDHKFLTHRGFDLTGIIRAAWVNLRSGSIQQGGSTLTQQLVKSYFLTNQRTLSRKLKELFMAIILDARFSKEQLLNAYINEIYLGQDGARAVHGFGLGSQYYFNKPVSELSPSEIALLITIIRGPSYYNPRRHPERVLKRRNRVLEQMLEANIISRSQYQKGLGTKLNHSASTRKGGGYYPAFMDLVRNKLAKEYDRQTLSSQGYKIFTNRLSALHS